VNRHTDGRHDVAADVKLCNCADPKLQDKAGTQAAVEYVSGLIQQEVAAGIPLDRIVVAGFSQVLITLGPDVRPTSPSLYLSAALLLRLIVLSRVAMCP